MATVERFEDLVCWQRARELTREVYRSLTDCRDYGFKDQIQRASVSVMSNIAEGFERGTQQELVNYLFIAKGSAGEVRAQIRIACDIGYLNIETFKRLNDLAEDCSRLIYRMIQSVKVSRFNGLQYKKEATRAQRERQEFDEYIAWYTEKKKADPSLVFGEEGLNEFVRSREKLKV